MSYQLSYFTYDADGIIRGLGITDPESLTILADNLPEGISGIATVDGEISESILENCYYDSDAETVMPYPTKPSSECYWDGSLKEYITMPERPSSYHEKSQDGRAWIVTSDLQDCKNVLKLMINNTIMGMRKPYLTDIPGQELIYAKKYEEASLFVETMSEPYPTGWQDDFPYIAAETPLHSDDPWQVAQTFLNMNALTSQALANLEGIRQEYLGMISDCEDHVELDVVKTTLESFITG